MKKRYQNIIFICAILLLMTSCGFHFGAGIDLGESMQKINLESQEPYADFTKQLRFALKRSKVEICEETDCAPIKLAILNEEMQEDTVSVSSNTLVRQYLLTYKVNYQLNDVESSITSRRQYISNSDNMLASDVEFKKIECEMHRDAVRQLLARL